MRLLELENWLITWEVQNMITDFLYNHDMKLLHKEFLKEKRKKKESHFIIVADFNKHVYKEKYDLKGGDFSLYR
ncbi:hypothetical protein [Chryseobacterium sp. G0201]|uniref:hypothetical protein n=1 Tax=Chryseobacterium sp. G0201 TaxID=2487065 RepID=UPI000F4D2F39|nr:hypothetical protein [Chryseobacterium sp. G0201]